MWHAAALGELRWIPVSVVAVVVALASGVWLVRVYSPPRSVRSSRVRLVAAARCVFAVPMIDHRPRHPPIPHSRHARRSSRLPQPRRRDSSTVVRRAPAGGSESLLHPKLVEYTSGRFWVTVLIGIGHRARAGGRFRDSTMGAKPPEAVLGEMLPERAVRLFSDASVRRAHHSDSTRREGLDRRSCRLLWASSIFIEAIKHLVWQRARRPAMRRTASCCPIRATWVSLPFRFRGCARP